MCASDMDAVITDPYCRNLNSYLSAFLKSELAILFQIVHGCG